MKPISQHEQFVIFFSFLYAGKTNRDSIETSHRCNIFVRYREYLCRYDSLPMGTFFEIAGVFPASLYTRILKMQRVLPCHFVNQTASERFGGSSLLVNLKILRRLLLTTVFRPFKAFITSSRDLKPLNV